MARLDGKIALITGGNSGIGLATARWFVREGARVFIIGRRQPELDAAAGKLGPAATAIQADVTSDADLDRLFAHVADAADGIDIVVANAGLIEHATIEQATPDHFDRTFDLNVRSVFFTVQKALPLMHDGGSIVLMASGLHLKGTSTLGVYAASKAAARSFARTWAVELADRRIRVNSISPGPVDTPMIDGQFATIDALEAAKAGMAATTPLGRMGQVDDIAAAALFLASDESRFVTGIDMIVDGGIDQL